MAELNITNIPAPRVPFIDERTGLMAREWYRFFLNLFVLTGSGGNPTTLDDLQIGPPNQPDLTELLTQINQNIAPQYEDQSGDFLATLDTAQLMSMMARFENAEAAIQGAYLNPIVQTGTIANYNLDGSPTAGGIAYGTGPALAVSAAGTSGQVLTSAGAAAPTWATPTTGTVSSVSVVSANGLAGTVATATTTPAITLSTTITGLLKGNGTAISAAASGADYAPATSGTSILYGNGSGGFSNVAIGTGVSFAAGTLSATGSGGTVTSVSFTGGIITVATATSTPALTVAGTSGGIPYFSSASTWATSAALAAGSLVQGGGAGVAPSTITTGTGVVTALGVNIGSAGAFVTFNGAGGTPSSMTATNLTGTASGLTAGTASAVAVGGITGLGTGVATALAVNVGSAGSPVVNGGALGTPSSGTVTNLTGTASININGTVGATTPTTGSFTTLYATSNLALQKSSGYAEFDVQSGAAIAFLAQDSSNTYFGTYANVPLLFYTNGTGQMTLSAAGALSIPYVWANTGGTTAVMVDSAGTLFKLASARKYKTDIAPYTKGLADVLKLDPQYYRVKSQGEDSHLYAGLIADDLDAQGLSEFVAYGPEGVDSINYGHMAALFTNAIKNLAAELQNLRSNFQAYKDAHP